METFDNNVLIKQQKQKNDGLSTYLFKLITDKVGLTDAMSTLECSIIRQALDMTGGNVVQSAVLLKISRGKLRHKISKYGLL